MLMGARLLLGIRLGTQDVVCLFQQFMNFREEMLVMPWFLYVPVVVWLRQLYLNGHKLFSGVKWAVYGNNAETPLTN